MARKKRGTKRAQRSVVDVSVRVPGPALAREDLIALRAALKTALVATLDATESVFGRPKQPRPKQPRPKQSRPKHPRPKQPVAKRRAATKARTAKKAR